MANRFSRLAQRTSDAAGSAGAFTLAVAVVLVWGLSGPLFHFSESWQLVINTGTTIVTFLMVFLIEHTQGREMRALQLKLDEIVGALDGASNGLIDVEELDDNALKLLSERYRKLAREFAQRAADTAAERGSPG